MMIGKLAIPYSKRFVLLFVIYQSYRMFFIVTDVLYFSVITPTAIKVGALSKAGVDVRPSFRLSLCLCPWRKNVGLERHG